MSLHFQHPIPLSLYVHYPWCVQKCPYCDFNSHEAKTDLAAQERVYLEALVRQLENILPMIWGRPIESVFFGGGTPSLISVAGLDWLMSQFRALLGLSPQVEVTLEANPGTVEAAKFVGFHQAGINRLSLGIQSFHSPHLAALGRIHDADQAWSAIELARQAGFERLNLDLMFALPQQTLAQALADVERAIEAQPTHISHYQLTLEPNTPFYRQPPILPDEDLAWDMQLACQARLAEAGYQHYEVSAFAREGFRCQHNLNYWQFGDYVGLGAGAHGKLTLPQYGEVWRSQQPASPGAYLQQFNRPSAGHQGRDYGRWLRVESSELVFEFMLNALRLEDGFDLALFQYHTGLALSNIAPKLVELQAQKWAKILHNRLELTPLGKQYLNSAIALFLD